MGLGRCCLGALCLLPSVPPLLLTGSPGTSSPRTVPCGACGSRLISCFSSSYSCGETETPAGPCGPAGFLARGYKGQQDMGRPAVGTAPGQGSLRLWRCRGWPGLCGLCAPRPPESGCLFPVVLASPARARAGGDTEAQRVHGSSKATCQVGPRPLGPSAVLVPLGHHGAEEACAWPWFSGCLCNRRVTGDGRCSVVAGMGTQGERVVGSRPLCAQGRVSVCWGSLGLPGGHPSTERAWVRA